MQADGNDPPANEPSRVDHDLVDFRWQTLFQKSADALFVLNRRRRILFVNRAWETATGLAAIPARGLQCRHATLTHDAPLDLQIRVLCAPPPEVMAGKAACVRRYWLGDGTTPGWWEVDYLPLAGVDASLAFLGRLRRIEHSPEPGAEAAPVAISMVRPSRAGFESLASAAPVMAVVDRQARLAASIELPFLVVGETGVGKRWLAGVIHDASAKRQGPLVVLACGKLPLDQCRALLTPRSAARMGWIGGTLFLQEPQLLPMDVQGELVERLHEGPAGAGMRVAAGMRIEPAVAIDKGLLLPDLAFQLQTLVIRLPALRERPEDARDLLDAFWKRTKTQLGKPELSLAKETRELLARHVWPANFHELARVLRSAAQQAAGKTVQPGDLPAGLRIQLKLEDVPSTPSVKPPPLDALLEQVERRMLTLAIRRSGGNKSRAADWLGIWRARLIRRLEALGLESEDKAT
jgi:DNA-binding NtrC family response regulator